MNPVETPYSASDTAGMVSTPEEAWIALSKLDPERIVSILSDVIARCLGNLEPDERRAVERTLAVQSRADERAAAMERSLANGERALAIKGILSASEKVAAAMSEDDPERIQEQWRQDRLWCRRMGLDFYDGQTRNLLLDALNNLLNRSRGNTESSSYLELTDKVLRRIDIVRSVMAYLHFMTSEISTNLHDESPGHSVTSSCHVARGPNAASASLSLVAA